MLIVLSGSETVHKKFFAKRLIPSLNQISVDGYTVDFNKFPYEVYDAAGTLVYRANMDGEGGVNTIFLEDTAISESGLATFKKIEALSDNLFLNGGMLNHYNNTFCEPLMDLGIFPDQGMFETNRDSGSCYPHTYADLLSRYNSRLVENHVITGSFSRTFIERVKQDLGAENVKVINITRNPSVSFLLNEKDEDYFANSSNRSKNDEYTKLLKSILNTIILKNTAGVETYKYEDIISNGSFIFNGVTIPMPFEYTNYNGILNVWEKDNWIPLNIVTPEQLSAKNAEFSNFDVIIDIENKNDPSIIEHRKLTDTEVLDAVNAWFGTNVTVEQIRSTIPSNLFDALGYTPLTYEQVIAP